LYAVGSILTVNEAVLLLDTVLVQPNELVICVIVTVVAPVLGSRDDGILKVPELPVMVSVAVLAVAEFTPLRLYVTVKVPTPSVVELTVTVAFAPWQGDVDVGDVKFETSGAGFTVNVAVAVQPAAKV
jgi:hypothetical protein